MSTRSNVAVVDQVTNKIKVIYVHSDGYPDGVGHCLINHYYNYDKAQELVNHGSASFLESTIKECNFYEGQDDKALNFDNEYWFMNSMRGDSMIEYIYLFRDGRWLVSKCKAIKKPKDAYEGYLSYWTKFIPVEQHKDYSQPKELKHGEVKMVADMKQMLSKTFSSDKVVSMVGRKLNKLN